MRGVVRVLGGAGTGKSSLLIQAATAHIAAGCDPESVLLLTGSARLSSQARAAITSALLSAGSRAVVPRTAGPHACTRMRSRCCGWRRSATAIPPPRLITSAEQDGIIRELLAGDLEDGDVSPVAWPAQLRQALSTVGFANELRDLLGPLHRTRRGSRCAATHRTNLRPARMVGGRPVRAGLRADHAAALRRRDGGACRPPCPRWAPPNSSVPRSRRSQPTRTCWRPSAAGSSCSSSTTRSTSTRRRLGWFARCAAGAELTVIAGDASQAVFGYRGADPSLLRGDEPAIILTRSLRCAPVIADAITAVARRLPAPTRHVTCAVPTSGRAR